jgi:hypothetical protein
MVVDFATWKPVNPYKGDSFKIIMGANSEIQEGCRNWILPLAKQLGTDARLIAINAPEKERAAMVAFLTDVENQLKITPSKYREANDLTIIELNDEWLKTPMRHSFLTMLLKIGLTYPQDKNYKGLHYVLNYPATNDWSLNLFYRNARNVWSRIQQNVRYFLEKGGKLELLDHYDWSKVKPKYEKDIGFINATYNSKENKFTYRGEVE